MSEFRKGIDELLADRKRSMIEVYFDVQKAAENQYGENALVLIEVGSFFEIYGLDNEQEVIGKPKEIAELLNLQLTRLNKAVAENSVSNPLLAGFPVVSFERYMNRLVQEQKYTIVLVRQRGKPPKVERFLDCVLSPGVNFEYTLSHDSNFLASVVIEENKGIYAAGYAAIDVTTGKSIVTEIHSTKEDPTYALDELFRLFQTYRTSEYIITTASDSDIDTPYVLEYVELQQDETVHLSTNQPKIAYQNELLSAVYGIESTLSPIEELGFEKQPLTSHALTTALEFMIEHDERIAQQLSRPVLVQPEHYMYLGNNPIEQLNVTSRDANDLTVHKLIDYTATSVGRRLLLDRLVNPITSTQELQSRYSLVDELTSLQERISTELRSMYDTERVNRRIALSRLHPFEMNFLYDSLRAANRIIDILQESSSSVLPEFIGEQEGITQLLSTLESTFDFDSTTKVAQNQITQTVFQAGFHKELDSLVNKREDLYQKIEKIRSAIIALLHTASEKDEDNYVQIKQLDKEGHYISITKSRYALIQDVFADGFVSLDETVYAFSDFSVKVQTSNVKITATIIDEISTEIVALDSKIAALTEELFLQQLESIYSKYGESISRITKVIARIDVALSTAIAAKQLRLCRPEIIEAHDDQHMLELKAVRHPLVEAREDNGIYVPNDVVLGDMELLGDEYADSAIRAQVESQASGVLLYGINASGKSSLMKSVGISVVLAQAGFYVPAEQMRFTIVQELFTRIVARDDFQRGLSSFGVEMMELKNIFNRCSPHSIILGDEISHGTETLSAIAIVSAALLRLCEKRSLFMFATHLHQLNTLEEIAERDDVVSVHMSVQYDSDSDAVIFDRTLQQGSGSSIYGLEFAQSLHMDEGFLKNAKAIRKRIANDYDEIELLTKKVSSKYNKDVLLTTCAVCQKAVEDVHHIKPQALADKDGNIEHIHKDHKYNLVPLCKECHQKAHSGKLHIHGFAMTSNGPKLQYEEV